MLSCIGGRDRTRLYSCSQGLTLFPLITQSVVAILCHIILIDMATQFSACHHQAPVPSSQRFGCQSLQVYPEKEKPPLQEVVTEEPPGALLDANSANNLQRRCGDGSEPIYCILLPYILGYFGNKDPLSSYLGYVTCQGLTQSYGSLVCSAILDSEISQQLEEEIQMWKNQNQTILKARHMLGTGSPKFNC